MTSLLNIPGLEVDPDHTHETDLALVIAVKARPRAVTACPHCGGAIVANGARATTYRDLPIRGKPVELRWERQRFLCRSCGRTATDEHPELHEQRRMTRRLHDWIGERVLRHTFASVAADVGVDEKTIRTIFAEWAAERVRPDRFETPRVLGIDEVHLIGRPRGVLANVEARTLYDMLPDRSQASIARRLALIPDRHQIELVCTDMWRPYRNAVADVLPQAELVIDRWHVQKMANEALESLRKEFRASLAPARRRRLMHDRFLLLRRARDLRPQDRLILETWTNEHPHLGAAYLAKETLFDIWDLPTEADARAAYMEWQRSLTPDIAPAYQPLINAVGNWSDPIFAYFRHRVTNAYTEALNGLIKVTNRVGRGYSFDVLRARMLGRHGAKEAEKGVLLDELAKLIEADAL